MLYTTKSFVAEHELKDSNVCFVGIPFDSTAFACSNQRFGPTIIRHALKNSTGYIPGKRVDPLERLKVHDFGDLGWTHSYSKTSKMVKDTLKYISENVFKVFLGGEHTITLPIVKSLKPKTIIQLDGHKDLVKGEPAHGTWAYHASKDSNLVQIGTRSFTGDEEKLSKKLGIGNEVKNVKGPVYLTVDMDVFDPAYAPETGFPEPGGLNPKQVFKTIDKVFQYNVIGMDVVELSSRKLNTPTSHLAARTILRALANMV